MFFNSLVSGTKDQLAEQVSIRYQASERILQIQIAPTATWELNSLEVVDTSGKSLIRRKISKSHTIELSTGNWLAGAYLVHFNTTAGSFSKAFIKA